MLSNVRGGILNLTPHDIVLYAKDSDDIVEIYPKPPEKEWVLRCTTSAQIRDDAKSKEYGVEIVSAPTYEDIVYSAAFKIEGARAIIVSMPVGQFFAEHPNSMRCHEYDILVPDTGPEAGVRDEHGQPKGTRRFILYRSRFALAP